jgi:hypothetical protein
VEDVAETVLHRGEFTVRLTARGKHWCDWKLVRIQYVDAATFQRMYTRFDADDSLDCVDNVEDAESVAEGHVKWDGCAQTNLHEHTCGPQGLKELLDALAWATSGAWRTLRVTHGVLLLPDGSKFEGPEKT